MPFSTTTITQHTQYIVTTRTIVIQLLILRQKKASFTTTIIIICTNTPTASTSSTNETFCFLFSRNADLSTARPWQRDTSREGSNRRRLAAAYNSAAADILYNKPPTKNGCNAPADHFSSACISALTVPYTTINANAQVSDENITDSVIEDLQPEDSK
ncbi:hypothetical protein FF38_02639 [Lucilia cuprina]|uniref:Uncharacterized protein n=1 Tax=Lucilia cuprina TaxID=7375 RepID=A0A0L0C4N5_LUCCU|nr:hypothetical protein FF38_02639 [Lucilia cuprina]